MPTNVEIPPLGESVTEAVLIRWIRNDGETVSAGDPIAELETEKANVDIPATAGGVLRHAKNAGDTVQIGDTIARIDDSSATKPAPSTARAEAPAPAVVGKGTAPLRKPPLNTTGAATPAEALESQPSPSLSDLSPAVRRMVEENQLDARDIPAGASGNRLTKEDVQRYIDSRRDVEDENSDDLDTQEGNGQPATATSGRPGTLPTPTAPLPPVAVQIPSTSAFDASGIKRVPMSKIRKKIAERLVQAQQTAAILTTFNEIDLTGLLDLRSRYKERFSEVYGVSLGLMSFFARACVLALREFPRVNAEIDGNDIVYHNYVHLGIAVSTDRGLAVPVLRNVETMSFAKIESEIKRLAAATREGKLGLQELSGGTFTITNGGIFGSLLSTPIINPPQSAILGMHAIKKRPMAIDDKIEVRSMMYVALSYDHRLIDGKESVSFLVRVKDLLEDPARLMLEI